MRPSGRSVVLFVAWFAGLLGCDDDDSEGGTAGDPALPLDGAATPAPTGTLPTDAAAADARPSPPAGSRPAGAACSADGDCAGGTCLGREGGLLADNPKFTGGYCTALGCQVDSQEGCGPDEWCIDGGFATFCVELCSKADGMTCARPDHVCLGLGTWGGCFHESSVNCDFVAKTGCAADKVCVRVGFEDRSLGVCHDLCDPLASPVCPEGNACYYIRSYNLAFCQNPGSQRPDEPCTCDACCEPGYACVPDLDGMGKHCKPLCDAATGEGCEGGTCQRYEATTNVGGCFLPGSPGT